MSQLKEKLLNMIQEDLSAECSSIGYAIMIDKVIVAEDSLGKNAVRGGTYNIGSISKVYCAVAVMQLVEKNIISLDEPVCKYLPEFYMPDDRYRKITLRHCLNHSSGLPGTQWRWLAASAPRRADYYDEVYRFLQHSGLHSEPGLFSVYCNDGFTLAEMVIAKVTGMTYGEYCKKYITDPIGAKSSRQSSNRNMDFEHTHIVGMPVENIGPEGAGGLGSTMQDLCRFGQLFLEKNMIFSEESQDEIDSPQGVTFLKQDEYACKFGLGWDSVDMSHAEYLLGSGVLDKGGGTREFTSRLIIVPEYQAVLAISATVDCGIDVKEKILELFAAVMSEKGFNIQAGHKTIPDSMISTYGGLYLTGGKFLRVVMEKYRADIYEENSRGGKKKLYSRLLMHDENLVWKKDYSFFFCEQNGMRYLMKKLHDRNLVCGVKAEDLKCKELPESWKRRIGKNYIICNLFFEDIVGCMQMNAFQLNLIPEAPDTLSASFTMEEKEGDSYFEVVLTPYVNGEPSEHLACGAVHLPYLAGRDLLNLYFEEKEGIEYCECSGYIYRDVSSLEVYQGQKFENTDLNQVYLLKEKLCSLPEIPDRRRVILLNEKLSAVYDSLLDETYLPIERGYMIFI